MRPEDLARAVKDLVGWAHEHAPAPEPELRRWGHDHDPGSNVVDLYVGYLRSKLGRERIATVRGMGCALEVGR